MVHNKIMTKGVATLVLMILCDLCNKFLRNETIERIKNGNKNQHIDL